MIIEKIRIKHFKSIIDSGDIYLEPDLTILAGKNETGKTTVLEALHMFNGNQETIDVAPIHIDRPETQIAVTLILNQQEINVYFARSKKPRPEPMVDSWKVTLTRHFITKNLTQKYQTIDNESKTFLGFSHTALFDGETQRIFATTETIFKSMLELYAKTMNNQPYFPVLSLARIDAFLQSFKIYKLSYKPEIFSDDNTKKAFEKYLSDIESNLTSVSNSLNTWGVFDKMLPNFIFFKSFDDLIPDEIEIKNSVNTNFNKFSAKHVSANLTFFSPQGNPDNKKLKKKDELNLKLKESYLENWSQDEVYLRFEHNEEKATIWVSENKELFKPSQRSKGKQWHLSFFFSIESSFQEGKTNIILIDEPALYLHAKAQEDVYNKLLETSKKGQIVFSTHSPYLMNSDELHRIRLIEKKSVEEGTKVNRSLIFDSDKETLTPILTSIGIGLNQGVVGIDREYNVIVEGFSDYFYLNIFKTLLNCTKFNFINGGGSGNVGNMGAILSGWGCKVLYLFDKDQGSSDGRKNLRRNWSIDDNCILTISDTNESIEDLFSVNDFKKFILKDESLEIDIKNSDFLNELKKTKKISKVIIAKELYNAHKREPIKFEDETLNKFKFALDKVCQQFSDIYGLQK